MARKKKYTPKAFKALALELHETKHKLAAEQDAHHKSVDALKMANNEAGEKLAEAIKQFTNTLTDIKVELLVSSGKVKTPQSSWAYAVDRMFERSYFSPFRKITV